jgi:serine/threonine protein kinase
MSTNQHHVGQYELVQQLTNEASSERWKAFDTAQRQYVVLSLVPLHPQANVAGYMQTITLLKSMRHPHIARILDVQSVPQQSVVTTTNEFIDGPTLAEVLQSYIDAGQVFPLGMLPVLLTPIASAIDFAHQHGIVHNALRPSNIMLNRQSPLSGLAGTPMLLGFCTRYLYPQDVFPVESIPYISPEMAQGNTENARSDIYSLGVMLYELCTGTLPFQGQPEEIVTQHLQSAPISPTLINPNLPPALTAVIMRALSREPQARFTSATSLVRAITRALGQSSSLGSDPSLTPWNSGIHNSPVRMSGFTTPQVNMVSMTPRLSGLTPAPQTLTQSPDPLSTIPGQAHPSSVVQTPILTPSSVSMPPVKDPPRKRGWLYALITLPVLLILIAGSVLAYIFFWPRPATGTQAQLIVGHAFFANSGQFNLNSDVGIADQLRVSLEGLPVPPEGKSYACWMLSETESTSEKLPILIGLSDKGGRLDLTYDKNPRHENLLAGYSRLLITLEDSASPPANPTLDTSLWRYYGEISNKKEGQYSQLDHLRHLTAKDPKLQALPTPLNGGLDTQLFRSTLKILEVAGSARDAQVNGDTALVQRQLIRILDYLDGSKYVQTEKLPAGIPFLLIDPAVAQVAILTFDEQNQNPPGYLKHVGTHLGDLSHFASATEDQRRLAIRINTAINNVKGWMEQIHNESAALLQLSPDQLRQPDTLLKLNTIFTLANYAFTGRFDPNTEQIQEGISQIHANNLRLATLNIKACTVKNATCA